MTHQATRIAIRTAVAAIALLGSTGCSDNNTSLFIRQSPAGEPDTQNGGCIYSTDVNKAALSRGVVDANNTVYLGSMLVGNQLVARGDVDTLKPETSRVILHSVEVEVFNFQGLTVGSPFSVPVAGAVDVSQNAQPAYAVIQAELLGNEQITAIRNDPNNLPQTVISRVVVKGTTLGGVDVESAPWDFPIDVCENCFPTVSCPMGEAAVECRPGQDFSFCVSVE